MAHSNPEVHAYKMHLFDRFLTEDNLRYVNIMSLDCSLSFFDKHEFFFFNTTGVQIGPLVISN